MMLKMFKISQVRQYKICVSFNSNHFIVLLDVEGKNGGGWVFNV